MWCIYALVHPVSGNYHYIGRTQMTLEHRLKAHLRSSKTDDKRAVNLWIRTLPTVPYIYLLEESPDIERERHWVLKLRAAGHPLVNISEGGAGPIGVKHSAEVNAKKASCVSVSQEIRDKIRGSLTGVKHSSERRAREGRPRKASGDRV